MEEFANDEVSEEEALLRLTELFQQGRLTADQTEHALRERGLA